MPGELPRDRALRLALAKSKAVAVMRPDILVVGSDQVAALGDVILDKPGNAAACREQLAVLSGRSASFFTACAVVCVDRHVELTHVDETRVHARVLQPAEIARYVEAERPFDCAGGFKSEGLGAALFERIETTDPTALVGLPLIWLAGALRSAGVAVP